MVYKPQQNLQDQLTDDSKSSLQRYQLLALGDSSLWYLVKYEFAMMLASWVPGALGFALRKLTYPMILGEVGSGVIFGRNVVVRHGLKISLADNVTIDDGVVLDGKGETNTGITIGEKTIISRNTILSCKGGSISIGDRCTIGINSLIHAMPDSDVTIGNDVLSGAYCYFIGSGPYVTEEREVPFKKQGFIPQGGINVADNVWFGSSVQTLDGVSVGTGSIVAASSLLNKSVEDYQVVGGVPAKLLKSR